LVGEKQTIFEPDCQSGHIPLVSGSGSAIQLYWAPGTLVKSKQFKGTFGKLLV
jgi:hypothetical protein